MVAFSSHISRKNAIIAVIMSASAIFQAPPCAPACPSSTTFFHLTGGFGGSSDSGASGEASVAAAAAPGTSSSGFLSSSAMAGVGSFRGAISASISHVEYLTCQITGETGL